MEPHTGHYLAGMGCGCASGVLGGLFLLVAALLFIFHDHIGC